SSDSVGASGSSDSVGASGSSDSSDSVGASGSSDFVGASGVLGPSDSVGALGVLGPLGVLGFLDVLGASDSVGASGVLGVSDSLAVTLINPKPSSTIPRSYIGMIPYECGLTSRCRKIDRGLAEMQESPRIIYNMLNVIEGVGLNLVSFISNFGIKQHGISQVKLNR
ncbi:25631_t:CDS:1, partial [Racocetra persica]